MLDGVTGYFGGVLVDGAAGVLVAGAMGVSGTADGALDAGAGATGADVLCRDSGSSTDVGTRERVPMICSTYASTRKMPPPHHVIRVSNVAA